MTSIVSIAIYKEFKESLFLSYIPLYVTINLSSSEYLYEEYLESDSIGEYIIKYKNNNNLTLKNLSNITGFSISHISNIINGKKASLDFINKIYNLK